MFFQPSLRGLFGRKQKLLNFGKIENMMKKKCFFFEEKTFHLSNLHFQRIGKAQNMPVVADRLGRLVVITIELTFKTINYSSWLNVANFEAHSKHEAETAVSTLFVRESYRNDLNYLFNFYDDRGYYTRK